MVDRLCLCRVFFSGLCGRQLWTVDTKKQHQRLRRDARARPALASCCAGWRVFSPVTEVGRSLLKELLFLPSEVRDYFASLLFQRRSARLLCVAHGKLEGSPSLSVTCGSSCPTNQMPNVTVGSCGHEKQIAFINSSVGAT